MQPPPPHPGPPGMPSSQPYMDYFSLPFPGAPGPGIPMMPVPPPIPPPGNGPTYHPEPWPPVPMTPMPMPHQHQRIGPADFSYYGAHEPLYLPNAWQPMHPPAGFESRVEHITTYAEGVCMSEDEDWYRRPTRESYASINKRQRERAMRIKAERRHGRNAYGPRSDGVTRDKARTKPQTNTHEASTGHRRSHHSENTKLDRARSKSRHRPSPKSISTPREVPSSSGHRRSYHNENTIGGRERSKSRHRPSPETINSSREAPGRHRQGHNSERVRSDRDRSRRRHSPSPDRERLCRGRNPRPVSPPSTPPPRVPNPPTHLQTSRGEMPPTPPQTPQDKAQPMPSPEKNLDPLADDAQSPAQPDPAKFFLKLIEFLKQAGQKPYSDDTYVHLRGGGSKAPSVLSSARLHGSHRRNRTPQYTRRLPRRKRLRGTSVLRSGHESSDDWDGYDTEEEIVVEEKPGPKYKKQSGRAKGKMERQTRDAILHQRHVKSKAVGSRHHASLYGARRLRPQGEGKDKDKDDGELNLILKGFIMQLARAIRGEAGWGEQGVPDAGKYAIGIMPARSMPYQGIPGYLPYDPSRLLTFLMI